MSFMWCLAYCDFCGRLFAFDPKRVPSVPLRGVRTPICRACVDDANPRRAANGLDPIVVLPGAYVTLDEAFDEREAEGGDL